MQFLCGRFSVSQVTWCQGKYPTKATGLCMQSGEGLSDLSRDRCGATVNPLIPIKLLKEQNFHNFKMTIKIQREAGLHSLRAMTWERGGDDGKLFLSSRSVNYSFRLIRLWPLHPPTEHPPPPHHHSFPNLTYWVNWFKEMVYFEEQIVALLTHCVSLLIGSGTFPTVICQRASCVCHVGFPIVKYHV